MKPKQNNNKNSKNNNKRQKQLQQSGQQQASDVGDETKTTKSDDVDRAADTAEVMTSSEAKYSAGASTLNVKNDTSANKSFEIQTLERSKETDSASNISDVEVADILHSVNPDTGLTEGMTYDPEVTKVTEAGSQEVVRELIMSKTFTESTQPNREFVPIRNDTHVPISSDTRGDDVINPLPCPVQDSSTTLTVYCELMSAVMADTTTFGVNTTSGDRLMTSSERPGASDSLSAAVRQVRNCNNILKLNCTYYKEVATVMQ